MPDDRDRDELEIQAAIEDHFSSFHAFPPDLNTALVPNGSAMAAAHRVGLVRMRYDLDPELGYRLTFLGPEGGVRTVEHHASYRPKLRATPGKSRLRLRFPAPGAEYRPSARAPVQLPLQGPAGTPLDFRFLFESGPRMELVLSPDLRIVAATDDYLRATHTTREGIVGRDILAVSPNARFNPSAFTPRDLMASCERVLRSGARESLPARRGRLSVPQDAREAEPEHFWSVDTCPVLRDGRLVYIILSVLDVTALIDAAELGARTPAGSRPGRIHPYQAPARMVHRTRRDRHSHTKAEPPETKEKGL